MTEKLLFSSHLGVLKPKKMKYDKLNVSKSNGG